MITVEAVPFGSDTFEAVSEIRRQVFVDEQGVHPDHEFDEREPSAVHLLARWGGKPVGAARCFGEDAIARVGRVAVLAAYRKRGVGRALMERALEVLRTQGFAEVLIHSQTQAAPFYAGLGFAPEGEQFEEEGIPHVSMRLCLHTSSEVTTAKG